MPKVTRIAHSIDLNRAKYDSLREQAKMLGTLRKEVWHRFGKYALIG